MRLALPQSRVRIEAHRRPELGALWKFETRRRHAYHFVIFPIERQCLAGDGRIAAEAPPPQLLTEHDYTLAAQLFVLRQERAAERRVNAQRLKEITRHRPGFEPFRFAGASEVKISWNTEGSGELLEGRVLRAIIQIIDRRYADAIAAAPDVSPRPDQSVGLGKRQRLDQHGVDYAEDRHIGADAHTERQNGDQREARILEQHSRA